MHVIAEKRKRFGSPRILIMLRREGWTDNHKKIERIYAEEGLPLRRKKRRKMRSGKAGKRSVSRPKKRRKPNRQRRWSRQATVACFLDHNKVVVERGHFVHFRLCKAQQPCQGSQVRCPELLVAVVDDFGQVRRDQVFWHIAGSLFFEMAYDDMPQFQKAAGSDG